MTATSTSSNSLAFRQILDTFNTSPPPSSQHHHLPDHLYLEPLQPIHEQPPSLIPRPRPMDRSDRMDRTDRPPLHQRASSSAGLGGAAGASAHAAGSGTHAHSRTPTGSTSRPKVTRQLSSSSMASAATGAPLKARVNTSSIVSLADVAQPTLRRKTPSTLSMRSESNTPARSQSPLHVSSSRSAVGSVVSSGNISPDKPTVRVAKVSPSANLASSASARLQRAASMRSTGSPSSPSPAGTPGSGTPSGPSTRRNSAQPSRARSPPGPAAPSQLGSAFGSAIASLGAGAPPRRASDDPHARMRRPSVGSVSAAMTGDRPVHVRNASVVSVGGTEKKPPLESYLPVFNSTVKRVRKRPGSPMAAPSPTRRSAFGILGLFSDTHNRRQQHIPQNKRELFTRQVFPVSAIPYEPRPLGGIDIDYAALAFAHYNPNLRVQYHAGLTPLLSCVFSPPSPAQKILVENRKKVKR
ncbi:hypothetical protein A1Q2_03475 [Trichosporon asahii var. asahii CBS 8904]|uniref:Uncharacterized protein n=1 Tax=Trichosporon asahii var. asahii (strain CBS 8904) TaxID=1220162 RepID=K1VZC1_TRIAC|nr:hypothetical protein A1Q2_03475 [Trichosporon asahii var. asahii CBS 8904]